MPSNFIASWLQKDTPSKGFPSNITILKERDKKRQIAKKAICDCVLDHLVGADIIASIGGFQKAAAVIRNAIPTTKTSRSGDFAEILATEYIDQSTDYTVPIRRLRYKDDRKMAMRGDDVLGFMFNATPIRILKTEAKSRANLTSTVVSEASQSLGRFEGRPNPSTLSFISRRLREMATHDLAEAIEFLQESDVSLTSIDHLIFTLSGNDPAPMLKNHAQASIHGISLQLIGCMIPDHASFIADIFDALTKGANNGIS